jgi:NDP-sugar pyrophosphorylase family protein
MTSAGLSQCIILAAGEGRRLHPLTAMLPKPMVPVLNRPLLAYHLDAVRANGITDVLVNTHHAADRLRSGFGDGSRYGVRITWRHEHRLTGPAGAMLAFADVLRPGPLLVLSGDGLHDIDLSALILEHRERRARLSVALAVVEGAGRYGVASTDGDGRVLAFEEKPVWAKDRPGLVSCGVYCVDSSLLQRVPRNVEYDFGRHLIPALVAEGSHVHGFRHDGYWTDIGTIETFRQANLDAVAGRVKLPAWHGVTGNGQLNPTVRIEGEVLVGPGTTVGAGALIAGPSVIGGGCVIGRGAGVHRAVLLPGTVLPAGCCIVEGVLFAHDEGGVAL